MDKDEQESLPTAPEVGKAPKKVSVAVSGPEPEADDLTVVDEPDADEPKADDPEVEVVDTEPAAEPEPAQPVPQLIRGTASTKAAEPTYDAEIDERDVEPTEAAEPTRTLTGRQASEADEPEAKNFLADEDEDEAAGKEYDPGRGDYVDRLNDTTPPPPAPPKPKKKKSGKRWVWVLVVLLLAAAAAGAYFYFTTKKAAAPEPTNTSTQPTTQKSTEEPKTTAVVKTKHYDSNTFAMGLDYPETWKVNETTTLLSVTSPQMSLKASDGTKTDGYIFVTVQPKQTTLPDFAKGSAVAVLQSEKATYKNPTQNQRAQTYMTFASYAATQGKGWDAVYVTGNNGYQVDQYIPMSDIIQTDPLVTVKFLTCSSQSCTGTTKALTLDATEWKNTAVSEPIKTTIQSFTFQ